MNPFDPGAEVVDRATGEAGVVQQCVPHTEGAGYLVVVEVGDECRYYEPEEIKP